MCGITGIYNFSQLISKEKLESMTSSIKHRGPDGGKVWISEEGYIGLGHRRLAIIDLSQEAYQPMHYDDNRYTIVFNGEIYNYIELRQALILSGYNFKTSSDTEVLLALFHQKGKNCLEEIDGMFAFAIYDSLSGTLFCARDRFGEKPFFYSIFQGAFYFASEMKGLWAAGVPKKIKSQQMFYFLQYNIVRNPNKPSDTFYEQIFSLEPSHSLTINNEGKILKEQYWDINTSIITDLTLEEQKDKFFELFSYSVKKRLRSDVPVGSSLSGGLDSSSIVMMMDKLKANNQVQKTFSARFENFSKDEGCFINHVIQSSNIEPYMTWPDEETFISDFEKLCFHQEEPFESTSIFAQWQVMKLAKENNVVVLLDGQGADEIAGGYSHYFKKYYGQLYRENKNLYNREMSLYNAAHGAPFELSIKEKFSSQLPKISSKFKQSKLFKFINKKAFFHNDLIKSIIDNDYPYQLNYDLNKDLKYSTFTYGLQELLRYCDRNSMAFSREVRLPFLDYKLVEFMFSLPPSSKINGGISKFIIREALKNTVPSEIINRKEKVGFETPQDKWLNNKVIIDLYDSSISKLKSSNILKKNFDPFKESKQVNWQLLISGYYI